MALMWSGEPPQFEFSHGDEQTLLQVAADSVAFGVENGRPLQIDAALYSATLQRVQATFVTIRIGGDLRGCMGAIKAVEPFVVDVAHNAYAAAFRDPRFQKVTRDELSRLAFHISVLSEAVPVEFESEDDLLTKIRPGIDGLILYEGSRKGTLLPAVWQHISNPRDFLCHVKKKAGLAVDYWSPSIRIERYTALSIGHD